MSYILSKGGSAWMGFQVGPVLAMSGCIQCCILLFTEVILWQFDAFGNGVGGTLMRL